MKHLILSIFLFICAATSQAQELTIKEFREVTNDLSARTQPRQDNNGDDCALVKVQLAASNATFSGNVMGDVAFSNNEYWVYMTAGSKRLKVNHPSYLPLEVSFADYGVNQLKGKTTYVLTLILGNLPQGVQQQRVQTGWILVDSEPQGAAVYINEEFVGNTPLDGYKQAYGIYTFRVERPNYHPAAGTIELNSGRWERKITLQPAFGSISVNCNVAGATVMLDGKATGQRTPCTLQEVASGQHSITVQMEKYAPRQASVVVEDGKTAEMNISLDARFATISIASLNGAQILCNGKQIGTTKVDDDMMEGFYDIEVRLAHHKTVTQQIQVVAGQPQQITLNPIPIYGSLDIVSNPRDAAITIDGKLVGNTPFTVEQILEGNHVVTLKKEGYSTEKKEVIIKEGLTESLSVPLEKGQEDQSYTNNNVSKQGGENITFTVNGVSFTMVPVEGGTFTMGATSEQGSDADGDEKPAHRVTLSSYYIGETEVTQELWQAVMGNNPSRFKGSNRPVECVSWDACQVFIRKLNSLTGKNFRLPTEAEWEFAARGGNKSQGYRFSGGNDLGTVGWYSENSGHPVKTKKPNELGIYDMSGNVWEWCHDWDGAYNVGSQTDPTGPTSGSDRVCRGGSWGDYARDCRVSCRVNYSPDDCFINLGLRLAL